MVQELLKALPINLYKTYHDIRIIPIFNFNFVWEKFEKENYKNGISQEQRDLKNKESLFGEIKSLSYFKRLSLGKFLSLGFTFASHLFFNIPRGFNFANRQSVDFSRGFIFANFCFINVLYILIFSWFVLQLVVCESQNSCPSFSIFQIALFGYKILTVILDSLISCKAFLTWPSSIDREPNVKM